MPLAAGPAAEAARARAPAQSGRSTAPLRVVSPRLRAAADALRKRGRGETGLAFEGGGGRPLETRRKDVSPQPERRSGGCARRVARDGSGSREPEVAAQRPRRPCGRMGVARAGSGGAGWGGDRCQGGWPRILRRPAAAALAAPAPVRFGRAAWVGVRGPATERADAAFGDEAADWPVLCG